MGACGSKNDCVLGVWDAPSDEDTQGKVSPILRSVLANGEPALSMPDGSSTLWEIAEKAFSEFADTRALGWRKLVRRDWEDGPGGKKFEKLTFSGTFDWMTYAHLGDRVNKIGSGLVQWAGLKKGDRVLIFAETQADWLASMLACFRQGATIVTAYATLGEEGVSTALNQTGAAICICDAKLFKTLQKAAQNCPGLKYVMPIVTQADEVADTAKMASELPGREVKSTNEVEALGADAPATPPESTDLAVIMYTSGTTGNSKGVMIAHRSVVSQIAGGLLAMPFLGPHTVYMAYLPMAHIMELFIEVALLSRGAKLGYGSPHTLTDTGVKLAKGQRGDAPLLGPTLLVFAPAVLDKVYAGVKRKILGGIKETLFNRALEMGYANYDKGGIGCGAIPNRLIMSKVQQLVGGKVTHMVTGSAPLSAEIQKFVQCVFNCPVRQGYGLTETCAASCVGDMGDNSTSNVGPPSPATLLRLRDWEEGGYTYGDRDKPDIRMPRGEVLIGGPTVADGYLVDPNNPDADVVKKNEEDFVTIAGVRYFCSGDIGQVTDRGCLQIIDRKKDLFKGENGEYVSLSKVEALLKLSPYVEMPMVYGRTGAKSVIALICPQKPAIMDFASKNSLTEAFAELCKNPVVVAEVSKSCVKECKAGGLNGFEIPTALSLVVGPDDGPAWSPDNEMLTTTLKLKRPIIAKAFAGDIDHAYARSAK